MCRFLLVRSKEKIKPEKLLREFALMCEKNHSPDGDWQGDGWGMAWQIQSSNFKCQNWETYKSLNPIWKEKNKFSEFGEVNTFVVHARSAGFPQDTGVLEYNQPYIRDDLCFVFNGMIKGVKLNIPLEGKIGAQKIFSIIQKEMEVNTPKEALNIVYKTLSKNSQRIEGMNIGLSYKNKFFLLCEYAENPDYFGIRYHQNNTFVVISSLSFGNFNWKKMKKGDIFIF